MRYLFFILLLLVPHNVHASSNLTSACLGQWHLNENAANSTVTDSCASLTGTFFKPGSGQNTSTVHIAGKVGTGAYLLDGTVNSYGVDINDHTSLGFSRTTPWSVESWFKTSDTTHEGDILSRMDNNAGAAGWAVEISSGKIQTLIISAASSNWIQQLSTSTYNDNAWHHLVVTYSGSSTAAGLTFYIDGASVSKASPTADNLSSSISYTNALPAIGLRNSAVLGASQPFFGSVDETVVYNRVLTAAEVLDRYNNGSGTESLISSSGAFFQLF